jgi:hypothetical protein
MVMIKILIISMVLSLLSACNIDSKFFPRQPVSSGEKVWSFIEYHVPDKTGVLEDYYYFGLVSKDLYEKIKSHEIKDGLIFMENIRYWNTDNVIESYEDEIYSNEIGFRIEHIVKFELMKEEPIVGFKYEDDEEGESVETENVVE